MVVEENSIALGATDTAGADCSAGTNNYLCGAQFDLVASGSLTITEGSTIVNSSNILVANATDVEVLKIRLAAANDEVVVTDLYLQDTAGDDSTTHVWNGECLTMQPSTAMD